MVNSNKNSNQTDRSGISAKWFNPDTRWTLLFIGNRGKPITLKRFKGMVLTTLAVVIVSIAMGVGLFFWNRNILREKNQLELQLINVAEQNQDLRHERDILMTRLVLAESRAMQKSDSSPQQQTDQELPARKEPVAGNVEHSVSPAMTTTKTEVQSPVSTRLENAATDSVLSVAIDDFIVSAKAGSNSVRIQFKLKNTSLYSQHVSGHAIVVLKGEEVGQNQWLPLPVIPLVDGRPTGRQEGNAFGISNFKIMKFRASMPNSPEKFHAASVYIFARSGELLIEQDFPLKLVP
jgi:hypothetical protein